MKKITKKYKLTGDKMTLIKEGRIIMEDEVETLKKQLKETAAHLQFATNSNITDKDRDIFNKHLEDIGFLKQRGNNN